MKGLTLKRPPVVSELFNPRDNSIGFLRWLMAFLVIFAHAGPIAGFYHSHDLGSQISSEQSLGGVAVGGFFFFSGFLIMRSRMGRSTVVRYFWRRVLRIMPAFWTALLLTAFIFAPLAWNQEKGTFAGFWSHDFESPLTYFSNNMFLVLGQRNIGELGSSTPFGAIGGHDWNGSAWTLEYEFKAYILVGLLGFATLLSSMVTRWLSTVVAVTIIGLNVVTWWNPGSPTDSGYAWISQLHPFFANSYNMMLLAPFAFGMLVALWGHRFPIHGLLAIAALALALYTYDNGGWNQYGQYAYLYCLMYFAVRATWLTNWERFGDFSYGVYIFAWPLMTLLTYYGLQEKGWLAYHGTVVVGVHLLAFLSWHLIEKPAMSLKDWQPPTPAFLRRKQRATEPPAAPDAPAPTPAPARVEEEVASS